MGFHTSDGDYEISISGDMTVCNNPYQGRCLIGDLDVYSSGSALTQSGITIDGDRLVIEARSDYLDYVGGIYNQLPSNLLIFIQSGNVDAFQQIDEFTG